jgi:RNA polymerase sigma-70 factor (ECF subfamily)
LKKIEEEYASDIFVDDDRMYRIKEIINGLDDLDRALLILYSDEESMAKTGKLFGVSPATICSRIHKIREIIKEKL